MSEFYAPVDPDVLRRERERARVLRASQWWKRRRAAGVCFYCRSQVGASALTMDHIVPLGRGGRSVRGNVVPSCKACNTRKQSLVPVEWDAYLRSLATSEGASVPAPSDASPPDRMAPAKPALEQAPVRRQ